MPKFEETIDEINSLEDKVEELKISLRDQINSVTSRFLIAHQKIFSHTYIPDHINLDADEWYVSGEDIVVQISYDYDDRDEYDIPLKYFTDESSLIEFEEECDQIKREEESKKEERELEKDREEFERLKKQFGE